MEMTGADKKSKYDLEQWKKALLSRDFDLVHTQLLMLDGDVTRTERAQLVQEIFTTVQQIEELTTGKPPKAYPESSSQQRREIKTESEPLKSRRASRRKHRESSDESYEPTPKPRSRHCRTDTKFRCEPGNRITCPVCGTGAYHGSKTVPRSDWYCNSCHLFKMRLEEKHLRGRPLPTCNHEGGFSICKGCRRFRLQEFWLKKRPGTPFLLPLMGRDKSSSDVGLSDAELM